MSYIFDSFELHDQVQLEFLQHLFDFAEIYGSMAYSIFYDLLFLGVNKQFRKFFKEVGVKSYPFKFVATVYSVDLLY